MLADYTDVLPYKVWEVNKTSILWFWRFSWNATEQILFRVYVCFPFFFPQTFCGFSRIFFDERQVRRFFPIQAMTIFC